MEGQGRTKMRTTIWRRKRDDGRGEENSGGSGRTRIMEGKRRVREEEGRGYQIPSASTTSRCSKHRDKRSVGSTPLLHKHTSKINKNLNLGKSDVGFAFFGSGF
jgi:hypothetical protein